MTVTATITRPFWPHGCAIDPDGIHNYSGGSRVKGSKVRYQCSMCLTRSRWVDIPSPRPADLKRLLMGDPSKALLEGKEGHGAYALGKAYTEGIIDEMKDRFGEVIFQHGVNEPFEDRFEEVVKSKVQAAVEGPLTVIAHGVNEDQALKAELDTIEAYNQQTRDGLRALCKKRGLTHYGSLNKQALIDLLMADDEGRRLGLI